MNNNSNDSSDSNDEDPDGRSGILADTSRIATAMSDSILFTAQSAQSKTNYRRFEL